MTQKQQIKRFEKICISCKKQFMGANRSQRCNGCQDKFRLNSRSKWNKKYNNLNLEIVRKMKRDYQKTEKGKEVAKKVAKKMKILYPEKFKARYSLNDAVKSGKIIKPKKCQLCDIETKLEGHHHDYSKPLDVKWLCNRCHNLIEKPLEELIEACGDRFYMLQVGPSLMGDRNVWYAYENEEIGMIGETPLEAVANLYIALNKK